ncbi:hypothetical protein QSI_1863 [Clostridioides difficile P28]|nr:hypothetical protein QSI_1863 [Clostridioides difficile P28]
MNTGGAAVTSGRCITCRSRDSHGHKSLVSYERWNHPDKGR